MRVLKVVMVLSGAVMGGTLGFVYYTQKTGELAPIILGVFCGAFLCDYIYDIATR